MATWSRELILEFIDAYRSMECLWKVKSKDYNNKFIKDKAYERLVELVKQFDPQANRDTIVRKINNLRSAFRRDLKKHDLSKLSAANTDEVYEPKLWYSENLMFLRDQEIPRTRGTEPSHHADPSETESQPESPFQVIENTDNNSDVSDCDSEVKQENFDSPWTKHQQASKSCPRHTHQLRPSGEARRTNKRTASRAFSPDTSDRVADSEPDQYDTFGKYVAHKLRRMTDQQCLHAERFISQILYEGQLQNLSAMAHFITN